MVQRSNGILSAGSLAVKVGGRLNLRSRLALTTILAVAPVLGYGRQAYADCLVGISPAFTCSGATTATQNITTPDADVSTAPGFTLTAPTGDGIHIEASGHLHFTDANNSPITATSGTGLFVRSTGNSTDNAGAITIISNGDITGGDGDGIYAESLSQNGGPLTITTNLGSAITGSDDGIEARNLSGDLTITAHGTVTGETDDGINAFNAGRYDPTGTGRDLTINAGADSVITGRDDGIYARNNGTGDLVITADGEVTAQGLDPTTGYGIFAINSTLSKDITITTGIDSEITGDRGIDAENNGTGNLDIAVNGEVTGATSTAIDAQNDEGVNLTVTTGAQSVVKGATYGITAGNGGTGTLEVTVLGQVTGGSYEGIRAVGNSDSLDTTIITGTGSSVTGGRNGIYTRHSGQGDLDITIDGDVAGKDGDGLSAFNDSYFGSGENLTITTGAGSSVTGSDNGIRARNRGDGDLTITANGEVTGEESDGIYAVNEYYDTYGPGGVGYGVNLTVTTGAQSTITGDEDGIEARNFGSGLLKVEANGDVIGAGSDGIEAFAMDGDVEVITGANSAVTGLDGDGISASASSSGNAVVKTQGTVSGTDQGIDAAADGAGGTVLVETAATVTGGADGIDASAGGNVTVKAGGDVSGSAGINAAAGSGDILVTTAAGTTVAGTTRRGIDAFVSDTGNIVIEAGGAVAGALTGIDTGTYAGTIDITTGTGAVTGTAYYGIEATATGKMTITTGGDVSGGVAGIHAVSELGDEADAIRITNNGTVANLSGETFALAIKTAGGPATINNNNLLIGTVELGDLGDTLNNTGLWNTAIGVSQFGAGVDTVNNSGRIRAGEAPFIAEITTLNNLEIFNNSGLISLVDEGTHDVFEIGTAASFVGQGGRLAVDADLAPTGNADRLRIFGNESGSTSIVVNLLNPIGSTPNFDGIPVVFVEGTTSDGDFRPEGGVLNAGFFAWDVRLDGDGHTHELITVGLGAGSYEFAAGITGAQDIWHQSTGVLLQRQADLRALLAGTQVTPVADFSEPVEPTPVGRVTPGLWFKGIGAYLERDQDEANNVSTDRKQEIYGFMAGFDFGTESAGEAWMFGLFGGYVTSDLDFDQSGSEWNYEGPSVGAYATYVDHAFYADVTVKADFFDVDIDDSDIAPAADDIDTDVLNLGGLIDAGYKMPLAQGVFAEPQASLAVVHTEIDDIGDVMGGSVDFEDETSVRGRLGLRLGHELTASNQLIYSSDVTASVWQEFAGDNDVTVAAPGFPVSDISDSPSETYGDVALGFSVMSPEGWSSFLRANYQFAEDYDAFAGNAGVRYAW